MLAAYAHQATLEMSSDADVDAIRFAVALELCGSWQHSPPCPIPHTTYAKKAGSTVTAGSMVTVRVIFAAEPDEAEYVRHRIGEALRGGSVAAPDGSITEWEFRGGSADDVSASELARARRLVGD